MPTVRLSGLTPVAIASHSHEFMTSAVDKMRTPRAGNNDILLMCAVAVVDLVSDRGRCHVGKRFCSGMYVLVCEWRVVVVVVVYVNYTTDREQTGPICDGDSPLTAREL